MDKTLFLYPLFALVLWTLAMAVVTISRAYRAVGEGLNPEYFRFGKGFKAPGYMLSGYQHYSNLFEMPVLYYVALITIYMTSVTSMLLLSLAWTYVVARIIHSYFHLSNTNIPRRRDAFIASYLALVSLWVVTGLGVAGLIS